MKYRVLGTVANIGAQKGIICLLSKYTEVVYKGKAQHIGLKERIWRQRRGLDVIDDFNVRQRDVAFVCCTLPST